MTSLTAFMSDDHRDCDKLLADAEELVQSGDWGGARRAWERFERAMRCHFSREEDVLFPEFDRVTGGGCGPTTMMRMEHDQIRVLLQQLGAAVVAADQKRFLGLSDSLMVLMQQHNMKEEQILYPMSEQAVPGIAQVLERIVAMAPDQG